jgi:hypothetical protein
MEKPSHARISEILNLVLCVNKLGREECQKMIIF